MAVIFTTNPPSFPRSHSTFFPLTDPPPNQSAEHGTSSVTAVGSGAFVEVGTEVQDGVNVGEVVTLGVRVALGVGVRVVVTDGEAVVPGVLVAVGDTGVFVVVGPGAVGGVAVGPGFVAVGDPGDVALGAVVRLGAPGSVGAVVADGPKVGLGPGVADSLAVEPMVVVEEVLGPPRSSKPPWATSWVPSQETTTAVCISSGLRRVPWASASCVDMTSRVPAIAVSCGALRSATVNPVPSADPVDRSKFPSRPNARAGKKSSRSTIAAVNQAMTGLRRRRSGISSPLRSFMCDSITEEGTSIFGCGLDFGSSAYSNAA